MVDFQMKYFLVMMKFDENAKLMKLLEKIDNYGVRIALGLMFIVSWVLIVATAGICYATNVKSVDLTPILLEFKLIAFIVDNNTALLLIESSILIITSVLYAAHRMKLMAENVKSTQVSFNESAEKSGAIVDEIATIINATVKSSVNDLGTIIHSILDIKNSFVDFIRKDKEQIKNVPELLGSFRNYLSSWTSFTDGFHSNTKDNQEGSLSLTGLNIMKTCFLEDANLLFENKMIPDEKKYLLITLETFLSLAEQLNKKENECLVVYSVTDQHPLHFFNYPHTADDQIGKFYFENIHVATYNRVMAMIFDKHQDNIKHIRIVLAKNSNSYNSIKNDLSDNSAFCCPIPLAPSVDIRDEQCKKYIEFFSNYADSSGYSKYFTKSNQSILYTYKAPLEQMCSDEGLSIKEEDVADINWQEVFSASKKHFLSKYDLLCDTLKSIALIVERKIIHHKDVYSKDVFSKAERHKYKLGKIRSVQRFLADVWVLQSKTIDKDDENDELNKILDNGLEYVMKGSPKPDSGMDDVFEYYVYLLSTCYWFERSEKNGLHDKADKLQNVFIKNFHNQDFFYLLDVESIEKENNDIQLKDKLKKIPTEFTLFGISSQSNNQNMPENDWKLAIGLHKRPFSNLQFLKVAHENSKKNNSGIGIKDYRNFVYEFKKIQEDGKWKQKLTTGHQESS